MEWFSDFKISWQSIFEDNKLCELEVLVSILSAKFLNKAATL